MFLQPRPHHKSSGAQISTAQHFSERLDPHAPKAGDVFGRDKKPLSLIKTTWHGFEVAHDGF
jgi:hypothetical protein